MMKETSRGKSKSSCSLPFSPLPSLFGYNTAISIVTSYHQPPRSDPPYLSSTSTPVLPNHPVELPTLPLLLLLLPLLPHLPHPHTLPLHQRLCRITIPDPPHGPGESPKRLPRRPHPVFHTLDLRWSSVWEAEFARNGEPQSYAVLSIAAMGLDLPQRFRREPPLLLHINSADTVSDLRRPR